MTYVITGATSFLGLALIEHILHQGDKIVAVCRSNSSSLTNIPSDVRVVLAEMPDYAQLSSQIKEADVFINLAWAGTGHDGRDLSQVQADNVHYSIDAFRAASRMGCKVFVEAGSQAEYGSMIHQHEDMTCAPFSEYGRAKLAFKDKAFALSENMSMKYVHLRIFSLFGETDHPWTLVMSAIDRMLQNRPVTLSPCTQYWNFLYMHDAAAKITALAHYAIDTPSFRHEIYNMASRDTRVLRDFVERMRELTHSESELHFGAILPDHVVSLQPDLTKLESAIGVMPETPFDDVIERIISIYHDKSI